MVGAERLGRCVELAQTGRIVGLTCPEILDELGDRLSVKLEFGDEKIAAILASLISFFETVTITGTATSPQPDRGDDKVIECSLVGSATHIVTGDRRHLLPVQTIAGVRIITPAQLIKLAEAVVS